MSNTPASPTDDGLVADTEVLIVDDSQQYALVLQKMLTNGFGFKNITKVESTEAALDLLSQQPEQFKLIFVDYRFPSGKTGGELLAQMKARKLSDGKVTFLITSEPTSDNVKQAVQAGAFGVVAKPFDRNELAKQLEKVRRLLAGQKVESF